ncbi:MULTISPECIES: AAA family ATPase [unclassified Micromonospora]|uniref:AAA family ATPase n=1 Tax=unclassified Micromonospora TaxID=2617518 RepID=UPI00363C5DE6
MPPEPGGSISNDRYRRPPVTGTGAFQTRFDLVKRNIEQVIHGKSDVISMALVCLFAEGHLLIEDVPGLAKTSLAKAIAKSVGGDFKRVQFTPDLLPSDLIGGQILNRNTEAFSFHRGPVFCNVLLGDEINRASPKTQSALLQVMAERVVTVGLKDHPVGRPFICLATQNPLDHHGTYPLSEGLLDRFMMRLPMGYPDEQAEQTMLIQTLTDQTPDGLKPVLAIAEVKEMLTAARTVEVNGELRNYLVRIIHATRQLQRTRPEAVRLGISPRGTSALGLAARVHAASHGQRYVTPDDVQAVAVYTLGHRLLLTPEAEAAGTRTEELLAEILANVAVSGML